MVHGTPIFYFDQSKKKKKKGEESETQIQAFFSLFSSPIANLNDALFSLYNMRNYFRPFFAFSEWICPAPIKVVQCEHYATESKRDLDGRGGNSSSRD